MKENIFLLTGRPGIGKTTVILRLADELRGQGINVCGMVTKEVRSGGVRTGFELIDIASGRRGVLASIGEGEPRVGRYAVNLKDLEEIGVKAIESAEAYDVLLVDELGPMELKSRRFKDAIRKVLQLDKPVVMTIHHKEADELLDDLRKMASKNIITVTYENRDSLPRMLADKIVSIVKGRRP